MIRTYALGFLVPPALMLALGWWACQASYISEGVFILSAVAPAGVLLLGWAALVANEIANRRSKKRQRPVSFAKFSFFSLLAPALMLLLGCWAWQTGYLDEATFVFSAVAPASVLLLAWVALLANEIANRRSERRQHQG